MNYKSYSDVNFTYMIGGIFPVQVEARVSSDTFEEIEIEEIRYLIPEFDEDDDFRGFIEFDDTSLDEISVPVADLFSKVKFNLKPVRNVIYNKVISMAIDKGFDEDYEDR